MKIIYFDQNVWIKLARIDKGIETNKSLHDLMDVLTRNINASKLILPISMFHIFETNARGDPTSRQNLLLFMSKLSRNHSIAPFNQVWLYEIRNYYVRQLGQTTRDLHDVVNGIGLAHLFGMKPIIKGKIDEKKKQEIIAITDSIETFAKFSDRLNPKDFSLTPDAIDHWKELIEENREMALTTKDPERRFRISFARFLVRDLGGAIADVHKISGISPKHIFNESTSQSDLLNFVESLPSIKCLFELSTYFIQDFNRKITDHDFADLMALSVAIPYCDAVVFDKAWIARAKEKKLDKKFGTQLLTLSELSQIH